MKYTILTTALLLTLVPLHAQDKKEGDKPKPAADKEDKGSDKKSKDGDRKPEVKETDKKPEGKEGESKEAGMLPADVQLFMGEITGIVEKVNSDKLEATVKVTAATAGEKNKAPKPESLVGMTITITPGGKKGPDGTMVLDDEATAKIKALKAGETATLKVRTSAKGKVFRLLTK